MTDSLAARLRRQAQELLDLAETLEPSVDRPSAARAPRVSNCGSAEFGNQQLLIQKAIGILGSQGALARATGVCQANISKIRCGRQRVSAEMAKAVHAATDGKVSYWQMRPDLFDAPHPEPVELSV